MTKARIDVAEEDKHKFYWMEVVCMNCGFEGSVALWLGKELVEHCCPKCECQTLIKKRKAIR